MTAREAPSDHSRSLIRALAIAIAAALALAAPAHAAGPLAPSSRTVAPTAVYRTTGTVTGAPKLLHGGAARLSGQHSAIVLDFGHDVGGLVTLHFASASDSSQQLGLAFSESSLNVGENSDASNGATADGSLTADVTAPGTYTMPAAKLRGGFRYLTLFMVSSGSVSIDRVTLDFTAAPDMPDPAAYPNWFHSDDELLNRIWYAGAYTVQLDTISPDQGRAWPPPLSGWDNSATITSGTSVLVDGAKRDRTAWPGDYGIAIPTDYAAFDDLYTIRNSLQVMYDHQDPDGALPYAGPPVNFPGVSDTYHMWTLIATADYLDYSGDRQWLDSIWSRYRRAMLWCTARIDPNGLFYVVGSADWARSDQGKENISANALLYHVLVTGAHLATLEGDAADAASWTATANSLRAAINAKLWDPAAQGYRDNQDSTLIPQDGNAEAVWFGVPDSAAKTQAILATLHQNWLPLGAHTPEWTGIHPFPGGMEVDARFQAGDDDHALQLIRREWGYMLNAKIGTRSTFWEGYTDDGAFNYEGTGAGYTSLAHGWATGPTAALTFYVLGLQPGDQAGTVRFAPHLGDLRSVSGRLTIPAGPVDASWARGNGALTMSIAVPDAATAQAVFPGGLDRTISLDGTVAWTHGAAANGVAAHRDHGDVVFDALPAGSHVLTG